MILQTKEQFIKYVPTAHSGAWLEMETYRNSGERWLKNELLGKVLYTELEEEQEDPEHEEILDLCRKIVSLDAYRRAIPFLDLIQSANGFGVVSNPNLAPASRDRVNRLMEETVLQRDDESEVLLDYLEDTSRYHDAWKGAASYSFLSDSLIMTARELKRLCNWTGCRQDFLRLKPDIRLRMYNDLARWTGKAYIDELTEQQRDGDLTSDNRVVLDILKVSLANFIIGKVKEAEICRDNAITFMDNHPERYPTYLTSLEYRNRHNPGGQNTKNSSIYIMGGL